MSRKLYVVKVSTINPEKWNTKEIPQFDEKRGPTWHCIVGRNFGSFVTHGILPLKTRPAYCLYLTLPQKQNTSFTSTSAIARFFSSRPNRYFSSIYLWYEPLSLIEWVFQCNTGRGMERGQAMIC